MNEFFNNFLYFSASILFVAVNFIINTKYYKDISFYDLQVFTIAYNHQNESHKIKILKLTWTIHITKSLFLE